VRDDDGFAQAERIHRRGDAIGLGHERVVGPLGPRGRPDPERLDHDRLVARLHEQRREIAEPVGRAEQPRDQHDGVAFARDHDVQ